MTRHWADDYYGDLYYESVADLLTARLSTFEAALLRRLLVLGPRDRVLDLACGHGRHARTLSPEVGLLVGLDRNPEYLARARHSGAVRVRGDLRALPLREGSFDALYSWYSSLFMYDDEENARCLASAVARLRPGALERVATTVPDSALTYVDGRPTVFVSEADGRVTVREVELGRTDGLRQEVIGGLTVGQRVVSRGVFALKSELFR